MIYVNTEEVKINGQTASKAEAKKVFNRNNQRRTQAEQKAKIENEITN